MARLPTFFQDAQTTYALFPGAPARGLTEETCGSWEMSTVDIPINMRWAVFHHVCTVLCSHTDPQVWVGTLEKDRMAFGGPTRLQGHMRTLLASLVLTPVRWNWRWVPRPSVIPEHATWFAPGGSL